MPVVGERPPAITPDQALAIEGPMTIHEEMLASIGRTAFAQNRVRIPSVSQAAISEGNTKAKKRYGNDVHELIIVGPDTVSLDGQSPVVLEAPTQAELLGYSVLLRSLEPIRSYYQAGFLSDREFSSNNARNTAAASSRNGIFEVFEGAFDDPVFSEEGEATSYRFGIPNIEVQDMRHSQPYRQTRELYIANLFRDYIIEGKTRPSMAEDIDARAASRGIRQVHDEVANGKQKATAYTDEQEDRMASLNEQQAAMRTYREQDEDTDEQVYDGASKERQHFQMAISELEPAWQTRAACRGPQRVLFFPPFIDDKYVRERADVKKRREAKASEICRSCPVNKECSEAGKGEKIGVWAGISR